MKNSLKLILILLMFFSCKKEEESIMVIIDFDTSGVVTNKDILFSDKSNIKLTHRKWTFEGGEPYTSSKANQLVSFANPGFFEITLEVFIESSDETIIKKSFITVIEESEANFDVNRTEILEEQNITFVDTSLGNPTKREWIFEGGEPNISTEESPVIVYENAGIYNVTLSVENDFSQDIIVKEGYIIVSEPNLSEGIVAYYPFDGNANDMSGNCNHGNVEGPYLTSDRYGKYNNCYTFDGNNDIIRVNDSEELYLNREFTISAWIYPKEIKSQVVFRKGGCAVNGPFKTPWSLSLSQTNDMIFSLSTENGNNFYQVRKQGYDIDKWYLVTGVLKDQKMFLYIDGKLQNSKSITGDIVNDPYALYVGTRLQIPSSTFNGKIDEIRIYNRALSDVEISYLYEKL